jgi:RNA polymerase sigma-70 factor (ECF subfamily)
VHLAHQHLIVGLVSADFDREVFHSTTNRPSRRFLQSPRNPAMFQVADGCTDRARCPQYPGVGTTAALRLVDGTALRRIPMTLEQIYEAELDYVWHTLRRLGVPDRDREDLAHDVFLVVHRRLHTYDTDRSLRAWLFGIAYRVVADHRRLARVQREVLPGAAIEVAAPAPAHDDRDLVMRGLAELDLERRAVFILHELDGQSIPEIARVIDAPENTLYSHLSRARRDFAAAIARLRGGTS